MSTPEVNYSAWMEAQRHVIASTAWNHANEERTVPGDTAPNPATQEPAVEPEPTTPDDLWQEWFGLWT
jgi:hypothetical protein